jgi:hypothetical protein
MISLILWLQQTNDGIHWTGDDVRTTLIGMITAMIGIALRLIWTMRDDVRDMKRDIHGSDGNNGIKSDIRLIKTRVDVIEDWGIASGAAQSLGNAQYRGPERRAGPRRMTEVVDEIHKERMRRITTDEHPTSEE